jgi:predicted transcriptional regulator of viral defense system
MERLSRQDNRRRLAEIAREQSGYFTAAQARRAGYSYQAQRYHAEHGNWVRVDRGIFRFPEWPTGPHEDLVRWTLWSRGRGVVSHETAVAVHDLGDVMPRYVHLTVPDGFRAKAPGVVIHRAYLPDRDVEMREGFSVTTPIRSILDLAASKIEIDQLARVVQDAIDRGITTKRALRERADEFGAVAALAVERALLQESA